MLTMASQLKTKMIQLKIRIFSNQWKVVEDGHSIPPGLYIRMNLQTGLKEARLLEEDEDRGKATILKEQPSNEGLSNNIIDQGDNSDG